MPFRQGVIAYARFRVHDGPRVVDSALLDALEEHALRPASVGTPPELQAGWTAGRHVYDTTYDAETIVFGERLLFGLRLDTNRVPASIRQAYVAMAQETLRGRQNGNGGGAGRRAAQEEAQERCREELAAGRHLRSRMLPALWDVSRHLVFVPAFSDATVNALAELFAVTFDARLEPLSAGALARERLETSGLRRDYEDLGPTPFTGAPPAAAGGDVPAVPWSHMGPEPKDFLGNEFLIWLWSQTEIGSATISTGEGEVAIAIDRTLDMECAWDVTGKQMLRANGPARLPEAVASLRTGKWPRKLGLVMAAGGEQWELSFQGDRFAVSGAKLPKPEETPASEREAVEGRLNTLDTLDRALVALFHQFLAERTGEGWPSERDTLRRWIRGGRTLAKVDA
ncbi:MAG: hypothetical protein KJO43_02250 [Phycisphaerae bacterium]|nr:hypothetical protein [Phycisphaerae bacterium]